MKSPGFSDLNCWSHHRSWGAKPGQCTQSWELGGPFFKGSYDLKSLSEIALVVLGSAGYLNDRPEQGIVFFQ